METAVQLKEAYKTLALQEERLPLSIKAVAEKAGIPQEEFANHYKNLGALAEDIWVDYFRQTIESLDASEVFGQYTAREKLLGFYYTYFEVMAPDRAFLQLFSAKLGLWNYNPEFLLPVKTLFLRFVDQILKEGMDGGEIEERLVMGNEYTGWHWPQYLYLLNQWLEDKSPEGQRTDMAIEKSVNLGFDFMGRNLLDSALDFVKFMVVPGGKL